MAKFNDGLDTYHEDLTKGTLNESEYGYDGDPTVRAIREYEAEQKRLAEEKKLEEESLEK